MVLLALCGMLPGCAAPPDETPKALMAQAEFLVREARWAEAIDALQRLLRQQPTHSGAHFYLGRCWLNVPRFNEREGPWLVLAEGELRLASQLFEQQGRTSSIERFSDEYFEVICNVERAKVYLKQLNFLAANPGRLAGATVETVIDELRQAVDAAKAIDPDSPDVRTLENILADLR
jgi:hypothetical protein